MRVCTTCHAASNHQKEGTVKIKQDFLVQILPLRKDISKIATDLSTIQEAHKRKTVWVTNTLDSNVGIEFSWKQEWIVDIRKKKTQEGTLSAAVSPGVVEPKAGVSQGQEKQLHFEPE